MEPQSNPTPQANQYDYILNAPVGKKRPGLLGGGNNKTLLSILSVLGVLFLLAIAFAVFSSLTRKDYSGYLKITKQQAEIIRVAEVGAQKARSGTTRNYAQIVNLVTTSEQANTLTFLSQKSHKVNAKELASLRSAETDKKLSTAEQTSTYDDTFLAVINSLLQEYYKTTQDATAAPAGALETGLAKTLQQNAKIVVNAK